MTELFDVNSFAEAMFYYIGRANNECVRKKLANTVRRLPTKKSEIEAAANTALRLEKLLDSKLDVDEALMLKYFKKIEGEETTIPQISFDFCLASVMVGELLVNHIEYSLDEFCKYLCKCSAKERLYSFCFGMGNLREPFYKRNSNTEEFSRRLENLGISLEDKWKIQSAAFNYKAHIDELLSLIIPAAKLIESAKKIYENAQADFQKLCLSDAGFNLLNSFCVAKVSLVDIYKVAPTFMGFNTKFAIFDLNEEKAAESVATGSILKAFIGNAYNITMQLPQDDVTQLSEELKVISDKTRLEILFYLCSHRVYGQELCEKFKLRHSTISYHLTKLMNAGFVTGELFGSKTFYSANKIGIQRMVDIFVEKIK